VSAPVTFAVDATAPDVALVSTEDYLKDALSRGLIVLAGCSSGCKVSATLSVPGARARRLGLRSPRGRASGRIVSLASRTAQLSAADYRAVTLQFSRAAKAALRDEASVKTTLGLAVSAGGRTVALRRHALTLSGSAGLRRAVRRGLPFAGACSDPCTLRRSLLVSRREARRLGLRGRGGGSLRFGGGDARASSMPSRLVLRIERRYRSALLRARH
jgi:hypothetical protein